MENTLIYITNYIQANFYLQSGLAPMQISRNERNGRIVFVYTKEDSQPYYDMWKKTKPV